MCDDRRMPKLKAGPAPGKKTRWLELYGGRIEAQAPIVGKLSPMQSDEDPLECEVTLTLDIEAGQLVCTKLDAAQLPGGPPITAELIRRIPVARLAAELAVYGGMVRERGGEVRQFHWPASDFMDDGPTDRALDEIARVFAFCMASGRGVTTELTQRYGIPKGTSSRWIATARRKGILVDEHRELD